MDEIEKDNGKKEEPLEAVLTIKLNPNGQLTVSGPIHNDVLCFGMMEKAKDVIKEFIKKNTSPKIVPPGSFLKGVKKAFGK